ncbi:MAG: hypothetical protein ACTHOJ_08220 [Sphingomonas oligoaromativorans]|uniref:hypothetical protein n=1 Tax=Sphingomonas oligoaromativorans TaxID=575322 RepID=UPI00141D9D54|nr:hypothetical protein [Sphingomonas oligoaromativorans]
MAYLFIWIDGLAVLLVGAGFVMTFRQDLARRILQRPPLADSSEEDSLTYGLRLAGTMLMAFGAAIAILFTAFHFES